MNRRAHTTVAAVILTVVATVAGQQSRQDASRTVSIYVESPTSWWSVSSRPPVFLLQVDGMPVEILRAVAGPQTIAAVMLFDVSGSMSDLDRQMQPVGQLDLDRAAKRLAGVSHPEDRFHIGTIGSKIAIAKTLLLDPKSAPKAAAEVKQRGGPSPLWDAIDAGLTAIASEPGLHAIMVNSDGQAAGNDISAEEILARAQRAGVSISAVGVSDDALPEWRQRSMIQIIGRNDRLLRLVRETGGWYLELKDPKQLAVEDFAWILNHLRKSYRLDFVPPTSDGRLHEISVTSGGQPVKTAKFIAYRKGD